MSDTGHSTGPHLTILPEPPKTAGESAMRVADLVLQRMPLEEVGLEINAWLEAAWDAGKRAAPADPNPFDMDRS